MSFNLLIEKVREIERDIINPSNKEGQKLAAELSLMYAIIRQVVDN